MNHKKYVVVYVLPSGHWSTLATDDRDEAEALAASEQARTGWTHLVYRAA